MSYGLPPSEDLAKDLRHYRDRHMTGAPFVTIPRQLIDDAVEVLDDVPTESGDLFADDDCGVDHDELVNEAHAEAIERCASLVEGDKYLRFDIAAEIRGLLDVDAVASIRNKAIAECVAIAEARKAQRSDSEGGIAASDMAHEIAEALKELLPAPPPSPVQPAEAKAKTSK